MARCLQGLGSESSVQMRLPQLDPRFLADESLQSVICDSRGESVTGCYMLEPKVWMVFCGNLGGNTPNGAVVSPPQELSQEALFCFEWMIGGLINWFFPVDVSPGQSAAIQTQYKQFPSPNGFQARGLFLCWDTGERSPTLFLHSNIFSTSWHHPQGFPLFNICKYKTVT